MKAGALCILVAVVAAASVAPASACACVAIEADMAYEESLVTWDGRRETVTVKLDLANAGPSAAVVFPV